METYVLIPAYEPDERLLSLASGLKKENCRVVIVDDGSAQQFAHIFHDCRKDAVLLHHNRNRGKGAALKTGLAMIQREAGDQAVVVTADCDGQHTIQDILHCADEACRHKGKLIIGRRNFDLPDVPEKSRIGNKITARIFTLVTGQPIEDTQSGLRAFTSDLIDDWLKVRGSRYEYETNVLLYAADHAISMMETDIETVYIEQNRSSHFHVLRDSALICSQLLKFALSSLSSFFIDYAFFLLFHKLTDRLVLANILARLISASVNYMLNRNVVFHHEGSWKKSLIQYILLAITILALNSCVLLFFTDVLHIRASIAKILTECILFLFSWIMQHSFIFTNAEKLS